VLFVVIYFVRVNNLR